MPPAASTLQQLHLSSPPDIRGLCWRPAAADTAPATDRGDAVPALHPGDTLRLDTFLNCFYERYWRELTPLTTFGVEIVTSGPCTIRLLRSGRGRGPETVGEAASAGDRTVTTLTAPSDAGGGGVLHIEIQAGSNPVQMHEGRWIAADPPKNPVALLIAICSFGREDMVAATLERMSAIVARSPSIRQVLVVHQGPADLAAHPSIRALLDGDRLGGKLRIVRQGNFGGSGGFARGMVEADALGATDVLLMDDDVRLEPSVLSRLTTLLSYLKEPVTLGGQMLDLHDPTVLYASHERVDPGRMRLANPYKNLDLSTADPSRLFQDVQASDYNAWWFCCLPIDVIRTVGLPLPVFIRHDDVEHGVRTIRSGRPLVTMPGLFVWHEAFESKAKPWQVYYERRNILVFAALHGRARAFRNAALFAREAWIGLAMGRYDYCWAVCRAAEDYLEGPDVVFAESSSLHHAVMAETGRHMLRALQDFRLRRGGERERGENAVPGQPARLTLALLRSLAKRDRSASLRRRLAVSVARMAIRLWLGGGRAAAAYRASARDHTSAAFWRGRLGLEPGSPPL